MIEEEDNFWPVQSLITYTQGRHHLQLPTHFWPSVSVRFVFIAAIYTAAAHRAAGLCAPRHRSRHVLHELLGLSGGYARVPLSAVDGKWTDRKYRMWVRGADPETVRFRTENHLQPWISEVFGVPLLIQ